MYCSNCEELTSHGLEFCEECHGHLCKACCEDQNYQGAFDLLRPRFDSPQAASCAARFDFLPGGLRGLVLA
jgi:hypothetical protein